MQRRPNQSQSRSEDDRGQSNILGTILIIGIVIAGAASIFWGISIAFSEVQSQQYVQNAGYSLQNLQSENERLKSDHVSQVEADLGRQTQSGLTIRDGGRLTITTSDRIGYDNRTTVFATKLGAVEYTGSNGQAVAYQGGGVFMKTQTGSSVMSLPPLARLNNTIEIPLVTVSDTESDQSFSGTTVVSHKEQYYTIHPTESGIHQNPVRGKDIIIQYTGEYAQAWGETFETQTDAMVWYTPSENRMTATLSAAENTTVRVSVLNTSLENR